MPQRRTKGKPFYFMQANVAKENVHYTNALKAFETIMHNSQLAVLEEFENPVLRRAFKVVANRRGYRAFIPSDYGRRPGDKKKLNSSAGAVIVLWDKKRFGWVDNYDTYFLEDGESHNFPSKWFPTVTLLDLDKVKGVVQRDRKVTAAGFHNVPGVGSGRIPQNRDNWLTINRGVIKRTSNRDDHDDVPLVVAADTNMHKVDLPGLEERYIAPKGYIDTVFGAHFEMGAAHSIWIPGSDHHGNRVLMTPEYLVRDHPSTFPMGA